MVKGLFHLNKTLGPIHPHKTREGRGNPRPSYPVDGFFGRAVRSGSVCGKEGGCAKIGWTFMKNALEESTGAE